MRRHARPNGKYIALRDAEREYGLPYHKLYRWIERGLIPRLSRDATGTAIYIKRDDLDRFLTENTSGVRA